MDGVWNFQTIENPEYECVKYVHVFPESNKSSVRKYLSQINQNTCEGR